MTNTLILFLNTKKIGGAEIVCQQILQNFKRLDRTIQIFYLDEVLSSRSTFYSLCSILKSKNSVLVANLFKCQVFALFLRCLGFQVIFWHHSSLDNGPELNKLFKIIFFKLSKRAVKHLFVSSGQMCEYKNWLGQLHGRVIGNPLRSFALVGDFAVRPRSAHEMIFVGRLTRVKGIDRLVRLAKHCEFTRFDVYGPIEDPRCLSKLQPMQNIFYQGLLGDEATEYRRAKFLLNVSYVETFGLTIIEGMKFGLPSVCSDTHAAREHLGDVLHLNNCYAIHERGVMIFDFDVSLADVISHTKSIVGYQQMSENCTKYVEKFEINNWEEQFWKHI